MIHQRVQWQQVYTGTATTVQTTMLNNAACRTCINSEKACKKIKRQGNPNSIKAGLVTEGFKVFKNSITISSIFIYIYEFLFIPNMQIFEHFRNIRKSKTKPSPSLTGVQDYNIIVCTWQNTSWYRRSVFGDMGGTHCT